MQRKKVAFIADSLDNAYRFQQVLSKFDADVSAGSTLQISKLLAAGQVYDLVVFEARGNALDSFAEVARFAEERECPLLVIVEADQLDSIGLPSASPSDFVVHGAGETECAVRVARLLRSEGAAAAREKIIVDGMEINLATYQVSVLGEPIDLTYLEYALLAFLAKHPSRTFSRDDLLQHVWGFDYYGGSRTVDVHVRRIRSKLGPELAQHLETVRGVGYLWSN